MAWFDDLNLPGSTITGRFGWVREDGPDEDENPDVTLASGTVTFTPTASAVKVEGAWVGIKPVTCQVFEGQLLIGEEDPRPLRVLSTDVESNVPGWGWRATFDVKGAKIPPVSFLAPAAGVHLTGNLIPITGQPVEVIEGVEGKSAYEVAVANGYVGTEAEWLASLKGDGSAWSAITGKPETFPPSSHTHETADITGLAARLAALEYRSGVRDVSSLAGSGWSDVQATAWRVGAGVNLAVNRLGRTTASSATETVFTLPVGYRPPDTIVVRSGRGMVARILTSGAVQVIAPGVSVDYFSISFDTLQPPAATAPGNPA